MRKHLGATLANTLFHMRKSGQFYLSPSCMGDSIEVRMYRCAEGGFNMKDQDESS